MISYEYSFDGLQWFMPVILASWEAEIGESQFRDSSGNSS
jgi:hypothetical protein